MSKIREVRALPNYQIWIRFADGVEGEVDLSDLVGKGVFARWSQPGEFERVFIDAETETVAWPGAIDLCPVTLYRDVTTAVSVF